MCWHTECVPAMWWIESEMAETATENQTYKQYGWKLPCPPQEVYQPLPNEFFQCLKMKAFN